MKDPSASTGGPGPSGRGGNRTAMITPTGWRIDASALHLVSDAAAAGLHPQPVVLIAEPVAGAIALARRLATS